MKSKHLIEQDNSPSKKPFRTVHWGEDHEITIQPITIITKQLKKAIIEVNLTKLINLLKSIDAQEVNTQFTENDGKLMSLFFKSIHDCTQSGGSYNSYDFKEIVSIFLSFDNIKTNIAFYKIGAHLVWNKRPGYALQIKSDYREVKKLFELEQIKQATASTALVGDLDDTDSSHMNKDTSSSLIDASTETKESAISSQKENQPNQRSHLLIFSNDNEEKNDVTKDITTAEAKTSSQLSKTTLNNLLAWIYELPEWLQNQILNSAPIKTLIESAEQMAAIYDIKSIQGITIKMLSPEEQSSVDAAECDLFEKAQISDTHSVEAIDMTMLYEDATVTGWILPTVGLESRNMFGGDAVFNGLDHFHGIDVF